MRQYSVLNNEYKIDLYLPDYRLAIEIDEKGHMDRSKTKKKRQTEIRKELDCEFTRINPDSKDCDMDAIIGTIFNHINEANKKLIEESTKKSLIDDVKNH